MVGYIFFCVVMLIALLILNIKMDVKRVRPYEGLVRIICTLGISYNIIIYAYNTPSQFNAPLCLLILALLVCPQFFATDYIQYRKNKEDIKTAQKTVTMAVLYISTEMVLIVLSIYVYYYF